MATLARAKTNAKCCSKCASYDHTHTTEKPCTEEPLCKNCCLSQYIKVDCLKKHSAFNRGCPIFKKYKSQLIQEALVEIKQGVSNLSVSSISFGSTHSLNSPNSTSFNPSSINNIADIINSCLDNKLQPIKTSNEQILEKIDSKIKEEINSNNQNLITLLGNIATHDSMPQIEVNKIKNKSYDHV